MSDSRTADRPARPRPSGGGPAARGGLLGRFRASGNAGAPGRAGKSERSERSGKPGKPGKPGKRKWTNLRPLVIIGIVVALLGAAYTVVMYSPLFDARTVSVRGTAQLTPQQVKDVAKVPHGRPLARVDLDAIRRRIAAIPRVESVSVERDWPHTVAIRVTERQVAVLLPDSGRFAEIDKSGVRFGTVDAAPQGVPIVNADPAADQEMLRGVAQVVGALPSAVAPRVRDITARTRDDIAITLDDGVLVLWGGAEDSPRKAEVLSALMKHKAKVYDVSVAEAPATRNSPL